MGRRFLPQKAERVRDQKATYREFNRAKIRERDRERYEMGKRKREAEEASAGGTDGHDPPQQPGGGDRSGAGRVGRPRADSVGRCGSGSTT